jgi:hypothetical protein
MSEGGRDGRFLTVEPGQRLAFLDDFVLVHLARVVGVEMPRALLAHGQARGEGAPQLALLYFVEASAIGVPGEEARAAWTELSRTSAPYYAASTLVIPGGGLAASATHAFVQGVRAVSGGHLPLAIFSAVAPALGWLRQAVPRSTRMPTDDAIEQLLDRMRAMT